MTAATTLATPVRTPKGERTTERILDVAEELFAERGYAGTTLRDVATRAGLRIPSLYNHFGSKESLYAAVFERSVSPVLVALADFVAAGGDPAVESNRLIARVMELLAERPSLPRLILHETLAGGDRLRPMLADWIEPAFASAGEIIRANPAATRWRADQVPLLVLAMYHVVVGYFTMAPLWKQLEGEDLLSDQALATQTQFLGDLVAALFAESGERDSVSDR